MGYLETYELWKTNPYFDEADRKELESLTNEKEIEDRFYKDLEFGTAGLRGVLGVGSNRMNKYNIRRATTGFALYLLEKYGEEAKKKGIAIAYDCRNFSKEFAKETALTMCKHGIPAYLYEMISATPLLSWSVRAFGCVGGVVVTASHNPAEYNGYKVYDETGCQIGEDTAAIITKKIESLDIIPAEEAIKKFENAEFTMNLGIYVCGNGGYNYDMETPLIKKIIQKTQLNNCMPYSQKKFVQSGNTNQKKYVLNLAAIRTREAGNDTPRIMCKQYANQLNTQIMKQTSLANDAGGHFEFDTEDERKNFWECYNHRFMLWTYTIWKKDAHIKLYKVPYFSNYTKPWTTKMFCDYFDITGYIDDEHAVPGSEWEEIMKQW